MSTAVVAIALTLGALVFVAALRQSLQAGVLDAVQRDADAIAAQIEVGGVSALSVETEDDTFFQVVSASGDVLASSENVAGEPAVAIDASDDTTSSVPGESAEFALAVVDARNNDESGDDSSDDSGREPEDETDAEEEAREALEDAEDAAEEANRSVTVIAGRSDEEVVDAIGAVIPLVAVAVPLLIVLVAATTWIVVGRALRPVERLRREVDEVTAARLDRRVGDPGSADEIGRLATTMNRMLDRLDSSQRAQRRFISDASHELKSPLASLRQYAEVARAYPDRMDAAELSDAVLDEGARLERLVQGMLVLAKADERSLDVSPRSVDLDDSVFSEASRLRATTTLVVDSAKIGPARIHGDAALLAQAIRNLIDNAARHSTSRVALSLTADARAVVFAVDDDGPGIPPSERERVFDRFVRLDEARARDAGGSGLGLSIVREIAIAHGGSVTIGDSALGGARVELRLPASSADDAAPAHS